MAVNNNSSNVQYGRWMLKWEEVLRSKSSIVVWKVWEMSRKYLTLFDIYLLYIQLKPLPTAIHSATDSIIMKHFRCNKFLPVNQRCGAVRLRLDRVLPGGHGGGPRGPQIIVSSVQKWLQLSGVWILSQLSQVVGEQNRVCVLPIHFCTVQYVRTSVSTVS